MQSNHNSEVITPRDELEDKFEFTFDGLVNDKIKAVRNKYLDKAEKYRQQRDFNRQTADELQKKFDALKTKYEVIYETMLGERQERITRERQLTRIKLKLREFETNYIADLQEWKELIEWHENRYQNFQQHNTGIVARSKELYERNRELKKALNGQLAELDLDDLMPRLKHVPVWLFLKCKLRKLCWWKHDED